MANSRRTIILLLIRTVTVIPPILVGLVGLVYTRAWKGDTHGVPSTCLVRIIFRNYELRFPK